MSKLVERLIIEIKEKYHLKYDEDVADLVSLTPSHLNRLKKRDGQPNASNFVKLAITAGWSMEKANIILNDGIASRKIKENGFINLSLLFVTSITLLSAWMLKNIGFCLYIM